MLRNIIAVVVGIIVGGAVNLGLVTVGPMIIPPPAGTDVTTMEGIRAAMPLMSPINFLVPFAAHFGGTFVGALVASLIAVSHKMKIALGIAIWFLIGGIVAAVLFPAPLWFEAVDLILAYFPAAWLGAKLGGAGKEA